MTTTTDAERMLGQGTTADELDEYEERAAIAEHLGFFSRAEAERFARERVLHRREAGWFCGGQSDR